MKTIRKTAIAAIAIVAGFASQAQATVLNLAGDTRQGFNNTLYNEYIGEGGMVRLNTLNTLDQNAVVDGTISLDFDFRYESFHVGLATSAESNNGLFTLSNGVTEVQFGSHSLDAQGGFSSDAFIGSIAGGDWILRLDNPEGGDPWASFSVTGSLNTALPGTGGGADGGAGAGGGAGGGGGGQVPVPAPLSLIAAMALFGAWRRKRSADG